MDGRQEALRGNFPAEKTMTKHPYDGAEGRPLLDLVIKGMSVVDRDGTHVGTVDKVEGGHLKILRPDQRPRKSIPICHAELDRRC
jgi:hypothetical protein